MTDLASNPIYKRMIQDSGGLSPAASLWMGVAIAVGGGSMLAVAQPISLQFGNVILLAMLLILLLLMGSLFAALIIAARLAAPIISSEDFTQVLTSNLDEEDIVSGFTEGMRYRFRLWIGVGLGFLCVLWFYFGILPLGGYLRLSSVQILVLSTPAFLGTGFTLVTYFMVIWPIFLTAGIWAALRDPEEVMTRAAFALSILLAYAGFVSWMLLSLVGPSSGLGEWYLFSICYGVFVPIMPLAALIGLRGSCVRLVRDMMLYRRLAHNKRI